MKSYESNRTIRLHAPLSVSRVHSPIRTKQKNCICKEVLPTHTHAHLPCMGWRRVDSSGQIPREPSASLWHALNRLSIDKDNMKRASELSLAPWAKVLVVGESGSAKTTWAARTPNPLILLTERAGLKAIRRVGDPWTQLIKPGIPGIHQMKKIINALKTGAPAEIDGQPALEFEAQGEVCKIQTLVLDSLTDYGYRLSQMYRSNADGSVPLKGYQNIRFDLLELLSDLRSLPINTVCITLSRGEPLGEDAGMRYIPDIPGTLRYSAAQFFDSVGFARKVQDEDLNTRFVIQWDLPSRSHITKMPPPSNEGFMHHTSYQSLKTPGACTLGSIMLALHPKANVAHCEHDAAMYARPWKKEEEDQQQDSE